eukprot:7169417-Lingulodinium_polyedra.AAC.1
MELCNAQPRWAAASEDTPRTVGQIWPLAGPIPAARGCKSAHGCHPDARPAGCIGQAATGRRAPGGL